MSTEPPAGTVPPTTDEMSDVAEREVRLGCGPGSNPPVAQPNTNAAPNTMNPASTAPSTRICLNRLADVGRRSSYCSPTEEPPLFAPLASASDAKIERPQAFVILPDPAVRPDESANT